MRAWLTLCLLLEVLCALCLAITMLPICTDKACFEVARRIKKHLNESVDPCEDFYNFACGGWMNNNSIPKDKDDFSAISEITKNNEKILKEEIKKQNPKDNIIIKRVKNFYASCVDTKEIERLGTKPVRNFVQKNFGWSWTVPKQGAEKWDFFAALRHFHRMYPTQVLFTIGTDTHPKKKNESVLTLDQAKVSLPQITYYTNVKALEMLAEYTVNATLLMEGYSTTDNSKGAQAIREEMKAVAEFESALAKFSATKMQKEFALTSLKNLTEAIKVFPWMDHIRHVLQDRYPNCKEGATGCQITNDTQICVMVSGYLEDLMKLISVTPVNVLQNYMMWRLVKDQVPYLSKKFVKLNEKFRADMTGIETDTNKSRADTCYKMTSDILGPLVGAIFIRVAFSKQDKLEVEEMMELILASFQVNLESKKWIDKITQIEVEKKLGTVVTKVGYPNYLYDPKLFYKRYKRLKLEPKQYYENVRRIDRFSQLRTFEKLGKATDPHQWVSVPQMVNAFYVVTKNEVVIPAGILQPPFFYGEPVPRSISYGAIGHVLGHELTHGFDNTGRNFDKHGTIITKNSTNKGWSANSIKQFNEHAKGLVKQFSEYKIESDPHPVQIDGKNSLGENIADGGGVKLAFMAYREWVKKNKGEEPTLPVLNRSNDELFFIGYAQKECHLSTSKSMKSAVDDDVHAPSMFRIIGTLSNSKFFAKTFKCAKKDPMNPKIKNQVWKKSLVEPKI